MNAKAIREFCSSQALAIMQMNLILPDGNNNNEDIQQTTEEPIDTAGNVSFIRKVFKGIVKGSMSILVPQQQVRHPLYQTFFLLL